VKDRLSVLNRRDEESSQVSWTATAVVGGEMERLRCLRMGAGRQGRAENFEGSGFWTDCARSDRGGTEGRWRLLEPPTEPRGGGALRHQVMSWTCGLARLDRSTYQELERYRATLRYGG